ncbi:hypothetical protein B0H14DRAFT_3908952 [Mycena olivaceomarginata]|nr:hypothetical protein B0H14DRAFT_3908952 [Mycena olivaceomarginata]
MLRLADLPASLWLEALSHAAWLHNRTETAKTIDSTPHERATGDKPDLSQIRQSRAAGWESMRTQKGEPEDVTYPSVPIEGELGENGARDAPDAVPEDPSNKSAPENLPAAQDVPPAATDAPPAPANVPSAPSTASLSPPSSPPRKLAPESSRPTRTRKPTQWLRDIAEGTGSTGGRGAAQIPSSVLPTREPTANTVPKPPNRKLFEVRFDEILGHSFGGASRGLFALTAVRADIAESGARSAPTSRIEDAPTAREASPSPASPTDEHEESAEEEDGVTKLGHRDMRDVNASSFHHRRERATRDDAEPRDTPPIANGHYQTHSIDQTESKPPSASAHGHPRQLPSCRRHNRPRSPEAQPQAHTPGHYPIYRSPSRSHRSPIARGNNGLRTKHVNLRYHHIRQAIDAGTIPLSRAAANDPTVNELIKLLVRTNLR